MCCTAEIHHGPGHQSVSQCERTGDHKVHGIFLRWAADTKLWVDEQAKHQRYDSGAEGYYVFSGVFNESPLDDDVDPELPPPTCATCGHQSMERRDDNTWHCFLADCGATNERLPDYLLDEQ